jgi:hypothetical protein
VEAEDDSALKSLREDHEKFLTGLVNAENIQEPDTSLPLIKERIAELTEEALNIQWIPDLDTSLPLLMKECIAKLTELECIAEMTDVTEQTEAFANYYAKEIIKKISQLLVWTASGGTLEAEDIQRIIKTSYLDEVHIDEKKELARIFGHHDILEKCETPYERLRKMVREDKRTELLTVLSNIIAHKGT